MLKHCHSRTSCLRRIPAALVIVAFWAGAAPIIASSLRISAGSNKRSAAEVEADYIISHIFVNEVAGDSVLITIFLDPQTFGVQTAEVFMNLNRRDRATKDADHDGIEDGIKPPP